MAGNKIAGVDVLVKIETTTPGTYTVIGGQSGATLNRETNLIEVTSKDDGQWASSVPGVRSWSVDCEGFMVASDAALDKLENIWLANGTVKVEIALPSGKKYSGNALIESLPLEMPADDAVSFSLSLTGTGALTITAAV